MTFDKLAWQRTRRRATANAWTRRYEKTPKGFLMRTYRNMKSRVMGVQKQRAHIYKGMSLLDKQVFYDWALRDPEFWKLFKFWERTEYDPRHTPSIDRVDGRHGYELWNLRWLPHAVNSVLHTERTD